MKNMGRNLTRLLLSFVGAMLFTIVAMPASAQAAACNVDYAVNSNLTMNSGMHNIGTVSWPELKNKCMKKAEDSAPNSAKVQALLKKYTSSTANLNSICSRGYANVHLTIQVGKYRNQRKWIKMPVTCSTAYGDCPSDYYAKSQYCQKIVCDNISPKPDNDTSFMKNQGFFFWNGRLYHRMNRPTVYSGLIF